MAELVNARRLEELAPFDSIDEGVFIQRIEINLNGGGSAAYAYPAANVAEVLDPPVGAYTCLLQPTWDYDNERRLTTADLPLRVARGVEYPIRCALPIEPCDRCPRRRIEDRRTP